MSQLLAGLSGRFGISEAVAYAVGSRLWQVVSGPVTQVFLLLYFTEEARGFYYTFLELIAMQVFAELGLKVVLISVASHEWSALKYENKVLTGPAQSLRRLGSLFRKSLGWYALASVVFVVVVGFAGLQTLESRQSNEVIVWYSQWIWFSLVCGLHLTLAPMIGILEGCGQIRFLSRCRFVQAILGSVVVWALLWMGLGLWCLIGAAVVTLLMDGWIALWVYRSFFSVLRRATSDQFAENLSTDQADFSWRKEVLPLQLRVGIQGPLTWLATSMPGLVVFVGGGEAGRWGMSWYIVNTVRSVCASWIDSNRPEIGRLLSMGHHETAQKLWAHTLKVSLGLLFLLLTGFVSSLLLLDSVDWSLGNRVVAGLLPWYQIVALGSASLVMHTCHCMNVYGFAHKQDYFFRYAVASNSVMAIVLYFAGTHYGISGIVTGIVAVTFMVQLPGYLLVWSKRQQWNRGIKKASSV